MTVTETTQDQDAKQLAQWLVVKVSMTDENVTRPWRQDAGQYAFDVELASGRNARIVVAVSD